MQHPVCHHQAARGGVPNSRRSDVARLFVIAATAVIVAGCAGEETPRLVDHMEEIEFDVPLESAASVALGEFDVPVAVTVDSEQAEPAHGWLRLQFKLWAETTPEAKADLSKSYDHHRGAMNDAVVTIVRTSSADELTDPRLAAIKTRMTDLARPLLGEKLVRQLVLTDIRTLAL
jgi:hypothetical protein